MYVSSYQTHIHATGAVYWKVSFDTLTSSQVYLHVTHETLTPEYPNISKAVDMKFQIICLNG